MHNHKLTKYAAAVATVLAAAACGSDDTSSNAGAAASGAGTPTTPAKSVVFFLDDSMGMTTTTVTRIYKAGEDDELTMDTLPEAGLVRTFSNDAQVTDSAPSMSAYMTGARMDNEAISALSDMMAYDVGGKDYFSGTGDICPSGNGKPVTTLLELMKTVGCNTGVIATTRIMHAMPAATHPHIRHCDSESTIVAQLTPTGKGFNTTLGDGTGVVFDGGRKHFQLTTVGGTRTDDRDLIAELRMGDCRYVSNKAGLDTLQATDGKVVGLLTGSHMSYDLNRDPNKEPSLGETTNKAIDVFVARKKDFFLTVEDGRIGHALHETTAHEVLQGTVAFDSATRGAIDKFSTIDPGLENTPIVVTADRNHTLVLNGYAKRTGPTSDNSPGVLGLLKNYMTSVSATDTDGNPLTIIDFGTGENRPVTRDALTDAAVYGKNYHQEAVIPVAPGGETHDGTDVFIDARDPGTEHFIGAMDNIKVFGPTKQVMDLQEGEGTS